jgi:hypothetical protein
MMGKTHHVFITVSGDELTRIVNNYLKKSGALKNVPSAADIVHFDEATEVCLEYFWDEK